MTQMFAYNAEQAAQADAGGGGLTTSTVARGFIRKAVWKMSSSSQSEMLELTFETEHGHTVNYLNLVYKGKNGQQLDFGVERIQALMGCTGAQSLSRQQQGNEAIAPELLNKPVALALERVNRFKQNGEPTWGHDIKAIMSAKSWLTINEFQNQKGPDSKAYWESEFAKHPEGKPAKQPAQPPAQQSGYMPPAPAPGAGGMDDEIPW